MTNEASPKRSLSFLAFFGSEVFIGSLVAILSILTAVAAYQGWRQEDISGDAEVKAIRNLTESNTEYIAANQAIILDYNQYDKYALAEIGSEEEAYYADTFSDFLLDSIDRDTGPFDDQYYDEQFTYADELYEAANQFFDKAELAGEFADGYQLTMLIFAVGLSLAAWGSLSDEGVRTRTLFGLLGSIAFCFGMYLLVLVLLSQSAEVV